MEKIRKRNILIITFSALAFLLFFSAASSTACTEVSKSQRRQAIVNNSLSIRSLIRKPTQEELSARGFSAEKYMAKEQTVTEDTLENLITEEEYQLIIDSLLADPNQSS